MEFSLNAYQMALFLGAVIALAVCAYLAHRKHYKTAAGALAVYLLIVAFSPIKTVAPSHGDKEQPPAFNNHFSTPKVEADPRSLEEQNQDAYEQLKRESKEIENEVNQ